MFKFSKKLYDAERRGRHSQPEVGNEEPLQFNCISQWWATRCPP